MEKFDLLIIGGGPAGYTGAIRAAQLGLKVAVVDKRSTPGGTCLNVGCIPSKALLHFSEKYDDAKLHFADIGIIASDLGIDVSRMMGAKNKIVGDLCKGISGLFAKNKVKYIQGAAKILTKNIVAIENNDSHSYQVSCDNILIATGSEVAGLNGIDIDEVNILSSTGALDMDTVPEDMLIIGAGVIGLELGSVWRRLGTDITVVEYLERITPGLDDEVSEHLMKILSKQGFKFKLGTKVVGAKSKGSSVEVVLEDIKNRTQETIAVSKLLVAVGRIPCTNNLGLEELAIRKDERGFIAVNHKYQTNIPNIYAVGDVIPGPMLAHKAEEEAVAAIEMLVGMKVHVNYNAIPSVIYTNPEVASIGATEQDLKKSGVAYKIGKFPFMANSRARATGSHDGFVKIIADSITDRVLGAHIIGRDAGTMISEIAIAIEFFASSEDIARTCHPHPTLSEAIKEAALAIEKRAINF